MRYTIQFTGIYTHYYQTGIRFKELIKLKSQSFNFQHSFLSGSNIFISFLLLIK